MAEKLIFAEQELAFGPVEELGGAYAHDFDSGNQFTMAVDQTYRVIWDGEPWDAVAWDASAYVDGTIGVGNAALLGLSGTNEPFLIAWSPNGTVIVSYDTETSHRIAIYQVVAEETEDQDYMIKGSTLTAIANSIRAKTGGTDPIKVSDMATSISSITGGGSGGSSADVRYVTFMSHDGTIEYGRKPVAVGDDCADPIARGIFDTPTRESDVQYNYTFAGWATTPNGGLDSNALNVVSEDRTLYANYISTIRTYTITYYDSDGTTVLKTVTAAYGTTPAEYTPSKSGYGFGGWTPAVTTVTGDANYCAKWVEKITFANAGWDTIAEISESGKARETFAIGDTKEISFNGETITLTIAGFDHDDLANGTGKAGMSIVCKTVPSATTYWGDSTGKQNYASSRVHSTLVNTFMGYLQEELRAVIKPVKKVIDTSYYGYQQTNITTVNANLWALSLAELGCVFDGSTYTDDFFNALGERYELFPEVAGTDCDAIIAYTAKTTTIAYYWLRDIRQTQNTTGQPCYVSGDRIMQQGQANATQRGTEYKIRFGFCI